MKLAFGLLLLLARSVHAEEPVHWPTSVLERQLTLPDKLVQVGGDVYGGSATSAIAAKRWITEVTPVYVTAVLNVLGGRRSDRLRGCG